MSSYIFDREAKKLPGITPLDPHIYDKSTSESSGAESSTSNVSSKASTSEEFYDVKKSKRSGTSEELQTGSSSESAVRFFDYQTLFNV